jgi:uncharacterized protein
MALPTLVDPRKLANQGIVLEGHFEAKHLPRLALSVESIESPLSASLKFEVDEAKAKVVGGSLGIEVKVICQRCLDPVVVDLNADFAAQVIWSEDQLSSVSADREPWIVGDKMADLSELLEEEVLLALPLVNYHDQGSCTGETFLPQDASAGQTQNDEVVADNPFNILKQLKK